LIAAYKNNRRAIGAEKESLYIDVARERLEALFGGTLIVRPLGRPVHVPSGREKVSQIPGEWLTQQKLPGDD
jgi:hypothetical protein